jgi:hypothetical protein
MKISKNLQHYVDGLNLFADIFKREAPGVRPCLIDLRTRAGMQATLDALEGDLSPENLCCDGELSGPALHAKATRLRAAHAEVNAALAQWPARPRGVS